MDKKVSIYDIARYLNLSVATVSYAINGKGKISDKTRKRVQEAINELGYVVNNTARSLSTGKSHLIGFLLPLEDTSAGLIENPFYVEFISGMEKGFKNYNYDIVIANLDNELKIYDWVISRGIDGIIVLGKYPKAVYEELKSLNIPIVLTDVYEDYSKEFFNIRIDDEYGAYIACKHLIDNGHTKIGFVGNKSQSLVDNQRFLGYKRALMEANIPFSDNNVFECFSTFDNGYKMADIIKDSNVTGVVCSADIIAVGIIKRYHDLKIAIPDDLSLVGFDDIKEATHIFPSLTTIRQDITNKAIMAAKMILDSLEYNDSAIRLQILRPSLIIRDSVKKLN